MSASERIGAAAEAAEEPAVEAAVEPAAEAEAEPESEEAVVPLPNGKRHKRRSSRMRFDFICFTDEVKVYGLCVHTTFS